MDFCLSTYVIGGSSNLVVTGLSQITLGASSLFAAERLPPRCKVLEGSYLILAGESSPVLAGVASSFVAGGSFLVMA